MRTIALAIVLGLGGIEAAIRPENMTESAKFTMGILTLAFFVCLVFGW